MYWIKKDQLLLYLVVQFIFCFLNCDALEKDAETELNLTSVQGDIAKLPCTTSARAQIALIIWYRSNSETPIYTVDLRAAGAHKHTSNNSRLRFDLDRRILIISNVSRALDQGKFRCRVDYRKHRSENTFVQLNVTVPPKTVVIVDSEGQKLDGIIGPFKEHSNVRLICEAEGGDPPPRLRWFHGSTSLQATSSNQIKFVRSELKIRNLTRSHLGSIYTCVASTGTVSIDTSIQLDLNLRPLSAHISLERSLNNDTSTNSIITTTSWSNNQMNSTLNRVKNKLNTQTLNKSNRTKLTVNDHKKQIIQLVDEQSVEIYCEVIGSRPTPVFSWYLGDQKLPSNHYTQWPPSNSRAPIPPTITNSLNAHRSTFNHHNFYSAQSSLNKTTNVNNLNSFNSNSFTDIALSISNQHLAISTLHFKPTYESDGKLLTCRAENSLLTDYRQSSVEHHVQLDVQYAPRLQIQLGANLRKVRESTDIYFECNSKANPKLKEQIQWYFLHEPNLIPNYSLSNNLLNASPNKQQNSLINTENIVNNNRNLSIERIFNKHVPSSSRASHITSLLFLDSNTADTWIKKQTESNQNNKNNLFDEDWLSLSSFNSQNNQNQITSSSKIYDQIDLKYFQLVTGGTNIIVADSSLVLQKVQRSQRGLYACSAANSRGRSFSKPIFLDVNYAPICHYPHSNNHSPLSVPNQNNNELNIHHHVHNHHNSINDLPNQKSSSKLQSNHNNQIIVNPLNGIPVQCVVDSVPSLNLKFHWMLSLTSSTTNQSPTTNLDSNHQRKLNQYTTVAHNLKNISSIFLLQDAFLASAHRNAQLLCWAENEIGSQKVPCVFNLIKAAPPDIPACSVSNETTESLLIYCLLGNNGGLESRFHLEVFDLSGQFVAGQSTQCNSSNNKLLDKVNLDRQIIQSNNQHRSSHDQSIEDEHDRNRIVFLKSNCNVDKAEAILLLSNLEAHQQYTLVAYAENAKGRSESLKFTASTVDVPAKHTALGDKQTPQSFGFLISAFICLMSFGLCLLPLTYLWRRVRRNRSENQSENTNSIDQDKLQQSVATVTNYLTDNVCADDSFDSEKYNSGKLKILERPLQTSPTITSGHVSITGTNHHFTNEITGITSLNSINTTSPTALLTANEQNIQYNQLPLVDYYGDQYLNTSTVNWPVAHNTDTLFMQLGEHQLKLLSNAHPQSLHLHSSAQNNAALLINAHHQLQTSSIYSNSPGLLTPNTNLNSPNIELATLTRQNIYRTLNKRPNDELLGIPQSTSMLLNAHQLQQQ